MLTADLEEQLMRERELRRQLEKHLEEERKRGGMSSFIVSITGSIFMGWVGV